MSISGRSSETSGLAAQLGGNLLEPGEAGFDEARSTWNARFGRSPDLIALCRTARDVSSAIDFARERRLRLSVKGCGHSYAANSVAAGGLLIDLASMKSIELDVLNRTATVEAGVTCGELDAATQAHGLAAPAPTVSSVGVIGAAIPSVDGDELTLRAVNGDALIYRAARGLSDPRQPFKAPAIRPRRKKRPRMM